MATDAEDRATSEKSIEVSPDVDHLCVLVHGLWGNPSHLERVRETLQKRHGDRVYVLVCKRNSDSFTYDGIEVGGERVAQEIEDTLEKLDKKGAKITKLSIVGYSLGGLIARYCIGLFFSRGWFDRLEPINFTAFASPFLGVKKPQRGYNSYMFNSVASQMLSSSGRQLFLVDNYRDSGRPLLEVLADPQSIFIEGLKRFKRRTLYANIVNDRSAPWYTTGISRSDPFIDLDAVQLNYMKGVDAVLLDPENPVQLKPPVPEQTSLYERVVSGSGAVLSSIPTYALYGTLLPIGLTAFAINAGIQTVRSNQRVQSHNTGQAGSFDAYRIPYLLDRAVESVAAEPEPTAYLAEGKTSALSSGSESDVSSLASRETKQPPQKLTRTRSRPDFPVLALDQKQLTMIDNLNDVGFRKYPVHIAKARHSHAAIIVRKEWKSMEEGYVVLKHWLDHEFDL